MEPLKILVIIARPLLNSKNEPLRLIDVSEARRRFKIGFEKAQIPVLVKFVPQARADLVQMESHDDFDILYYLGHGNKDGSLCFEDELGKVHLIDPSKFPQILNLNRTPKPKLVLISACHSEAIVTQIHNLNIPAIAVMGDKTMHERAAILFNQLFFNSWTCGKTLNESFDEGIKAVRNDAEVGDKSCKKNPIFANDPIPYADRFLLFADSDQKRIRLIKEKVKPFKADYQEKRVNIICSLPQLTENFVGREKEIHNVLQSLQKHKIVAITGAAGLGKTELAKAVGWYLQERGYYKEGIFWASDRSDENRYPLRGLESLYNSILLGKTGQPAEQVPIDQKEKAVKDIIASGDALLVLDNFETVEKDKELLSFLKELPHDSRVLIATSTMYNLKLRILRAIYCRSRQPLKQG